MTNYRIVPVEPTRKMIDTMALYEEDGYQDMWREAQRVSPNPTKDPELVERVAIQIYEAACKRMGLAVLPWDEIRPAAGQSDWLGMARAALKAIQGDKE